MAHIQRVKLKRKKGGKPQQSYRVRWVDPDRKDRLACFRTLAEAESFRDSVAVQVRDGSYIDPAQSRVLFKDFAEEWLKTKADLKPKTLDGYQSLLEAHLYPAFENVQLGRIRPMDIDAFLAKMSKKPRREADPAGERLSASRLRQARQLLHAIFKAAVANDRLRRNPVDGSTFKIRSRHRQIRPLEIAQVEAVAAQIEPRYRTLLYVLATGGPRWGEAAALRRKDCNLLLNRLEVSQSVTEVARQIDENTGEKPPKGEGSTLHFSDTKSHASRDVYLPKFVMAMLRDHLETYTDASPDALVFTIPDGSVVRNSNFRPKVWIPALRAAGLPTTIRLHDLRHTAASILLSQGASIKTVQKQLGHSTTMLTLDVYAALMENEQQEAVERMDEAFGRKAREQ